MELTIDNEHQHIIYEENSFDETLEPLKDAVQSKSSYLVLLVGKLKKQKNRALQKIQDHTELDVQQVDANELITENESEAQQRVDQLFEQFSPEEIICIKQRG